MEIDKKIKILHTIKMTDAERTKIRGSVVLFMDRGVASHVSPYSIQSPYAFFTLLRGSKALALILILAVVIGSGGTLSFAASRSLPGELLWPVKNINEQMAVSLAPTPAKKAEIQKSRIKTRLEEATTLKATGKLTSDKTKIVQSAFVDQAKDLNTTIDTLQADGNKEAVLAVTQDLIPTLVSFKAASDATTAEAAPLSTNTPVSTNDATTPLPVAMSGSDATAPEVSSKDNSLSDAKDASATRDFNAIIEHEVEHIKLQQDETLKDVSVANSTTIIAPANETPDQNAILPLPDSSGTPLNETLPLSDPLLETTLNGLLPDDATFNENTSLDEEVSLNVKNKIPATSVISTSAKIKAPTLVGTLWLSPVVCAASTTCEPVPDTSGTRSILVYSADKSIIIAQIKVAADGSFSATLSPGEYIIDLLKTGIDSTKDLPEAVTIPSSGLVTLSITVVK